MLNVNAEELLEEESAELKEHINAAKAIQAITATEGVTVDEVQKQMKLAMLVGLSNSDPDMQVQWKKIPCKGDAPTPGKLITYLATHLHGGEDARA